MTRHEFAAAGPLRRRVRLLVTRGPVAALSGTLLPPLDRAAFKLTAGRFTPSAWVTGLPVVQLTTIGRRSGEPRTARVLAVPDGDGLLVVGANFGGAQHPAWCHNLRAHPRARVDGVEYTARELHGEERERGFQRALILNPGWRRFQQRAGERAIPVLRMTRV